MPVKFWQMIVRFWFYLSYLITTVLLRSLWFCNSWTNCIQVNMIWHEKRLLVFNYEMGFFVKQCFKKFKRIILHFIQTWIISRVCVLTVPSPYASHWIKLNGTVVIMNQNWICTLRNGLEILLSWRSWCSFPY
jgi:hypothetical protein